MNLPVVGRTPIRTRSPTSTLEFPAIVKFPVESVVAIPKLPSDESGISPTRTPGFRELVTTPEKVAILGREALMLLTAALMTVNVEASLNVVWPP